MHRHISACTHIPLHICTNISAHNTHTYTNNENKVLGAGRASKYIFLILYIEF